jgi:UDP-glucose 4-epimerase
MVDLKNKRILVTGSDGFIGKYTVDLLKQLGAIPVEFDYKRGQDVKQSGDLEPIFNEKVYGIIHLGAKISVPESFKEPGEYFHVNTCGTLNILELARKYKVKKIVLASSSAVEGLNSPYAHSKYLAEKLCKIYNNFYNLNIICLRYFNVYGYGQDLNGGAIVSSLIKRFLNNQYPIIHGNGTQMRDFVYVEEVARANVMALASKTKEFMGVFDIGTGHPQTILSIVDILKEITKKQDLNPIFIEQRDGDVSYSCANGLELTKEFLKWENKCGFIDGLKKTWEKYNV